MVGFVDVSVDEVKDFIEQFTVDQFGMLQEYVNDMPALTHDLSWKCSTCDTKNTITLKGTADFFQ